MIRNRALRLALKALEQQMRRYVFAANLEKAGHRSIFIESDAKRYAELEAARHAIEAMMEEEA